MPQRVAIDGNGRFVKNGIYFVELGRELWGEIFFLLNIITREGRKYHKGAQSGGEKGGIGAESLAVLGESF